MSETGPIHVIDDDDAVRESLAFLFESEGLCVISHASGQAALEAIIAGGASCVVTDVRMPGMSGVDLLRALKSAGVKAPVIVITGHGDVTLAVEAMKAGAADFIEKPFDDALLLAAVERALEERADVVDPGLDRRLTRLSQRERQVLAGLVDGRLNKTIAHELGISVRTVEVYRAKLMSKMEAETFADLVRMAVLAGIASPRQD